jgi:hypothetical protein
MYPRTGIAIVAASLAACSQAPQAPSDTGPANPTAVFETLIVNSGIFGALPFEVHEGNTCAPTCGATSTA